jgi:hypothetical protein
MKMRVEHFVGVAFAVACGSCSGGGGNTSGTGGANATSTSTTASASTSGSGGGATSSSSSGSGGSTSDGGTSASCNGIRYCDDFESYTTGAVANNMALGPWKASVAGVMMTVDGVKPYGGKKSLHIVAPTGAAAHGTLNQTVTAGLVPGNDVFGRAMVFYSNTGGNGLPLNVHSWIFNAAGTSTAAMGMVTMNMGGGGAKLQLNYHPPAPGTEQSVQGGMITAGTWHCIQWQYNGSGTPVADDAKVWVDGTLAVEAMQSKGWSFATPWTSFDFGFTHYQTLANGVDVYLDDFGLNETMIPCPP